VYRECRPHAKQEGNKQQPIELCYTQPAKPDQNTYIERELSRESAVEALPAEETRELGAVKGVTDEGFTIRAAPE